MPSFACPATGALLEQVPYPWIPSAADGKYRQSGVCVEQRQTLPHRHSVDNNDLHSIHIAISTMGDPEMTYEVREDACESQDVTGHPIQALENSWILLPKRGPGTTLWILRDTRLSFNSHKTPSDG